MSRAQSADDGMCAFEGETRKEGSSESEADCTVRLDVGGTDQAIMRFLSVST